MIMNIIRHGDQLLKLVSKIPKDAKPIKTDILAYGEATGHHHKFRGGQVQILETPEQRFVKVEQETVLEHQEHRPLPIPKGIYEVVQEREYNPLNEQIRRVVD